jgi:hypothetical protein
MEKAGAMPAFLRLACRRAPSTTPGSNRPVTGTIGELIEHRP